MLQEFIREQFVSDGMCADAAIHDTDGHNPHAHILLTVRPLDEQGKWQYKTEKEYLCMKNSEERGFTAAEFRTAKTMDGRSNTPTRSARRRCIWCRLLPRRRDLFGLTSIPKAPATADKILSPSSGTAKNSF